MKIFKIICYTIEFIVVMALVWHWLKQCAANHQPTETNDDKEASAISGHKSIQMLKRYTQEIKK